METRYKIIPVALTCGPRQQAAYKKSYLNRIGGSMKHISLTVLFMLAPLLFLSASGEQEGSPVQQGAENLIAASR